MDGTFAPPLWGSARARARARLLFRAALFGAIVGAGFGVVRGTSIGAGYVVISIVKGITVGALLSVMLVWLEQIVLRRFWRRLSLGRAILMRTVVYAPLTTGAYLLVAAGFSPWLPWNLQRPMILPVLGMSVACLLVGSSMIAVRRLLGYRVILNLFSGRYRRPFEEDRIFLFLDLSGSTSIAERIGHLRYHSFLRDFIEDLEEPVLEHDGDVYQYVGDEVVLTWPMTDRRSNGRCVACHFAIVEAMDRSREGYEAKFGAVPTFRTGIHCGRVVAGEIGDQRKQVVFVGDVVNTAARMEAEARARGKNLVVSGTLLSQIELPPGLLARPLGAVKPKGKEVMVELFEIVRTASG